MSDKVYRIVLENGSEEQPKTTAPTTEGTAEPNDTSLPKSKFKVAVAYGATVSIIDKCISPSINTVTLRTGYEQAQEKMQYIYGRAKQGLNILSSIALGGSVAGVAGAMVGAAVSIGNELYNIAVRQNEINIARENENYSIFLNHLRMGAGRNREGKTR